MVAILREQMVAGRLTSAELDERAGLAYTAKRWDDLRNLVQDLPVTLRFSDERSPAAPPPPPQVHRARPRRVPHLLPIALVCFVLIVASERVLFLAPLIVFGVVVTLIAFALGWASRR